MPSLNLSKEKLQFVKGAFLKKEDGLIKIQHYETDIFVYDPQTGKAEILKDCSMTSNRMNQRAVYFFEPKEVKEIQVQKWSYSGGFM